MLVLTFARPVVYGLLVCVVAVGGAAADDASQSSAVAASRTEAQAKAGSTATPRMTANPDGARVRVETRTRVLPEALDPLKRPASRAGLRVYLDSEGRVVPAPPGSMPPARRVPQPQFVDLFVGTSSGGGIGADASHMTSYSYVTVGPDGTFEEGCLQGTLEDVREKVERKVRRK